MTQMIEVYTSATTATPAPAAEPVQELQSTFTWVKASSTVRGADPYISEQLAAEIREALAGAARGEAVDLGDFTQYAEDPDDED